MPTPTPQQALAIETLDRALVVEAGAGTGKTWVLVARYLHQLDQHPDWPIDSIVAITFTEKAAREMRNRIRAGVEERARQGDPQGPWQQRRRQLDQINVSTIHSLCARLLREHAIAAALDPRFEVLEEEEAGLLAEEAVRQTLAELSESEEHPALSLFASLSTWDVKNTMADLLAKRGTLQRLFDELDEAELLLSRWEEALADMLVQRWRRALNMDPDLAEAMDFLPSVTIVDPADKLADAVRCAQRGCEHIQEGDIARAMECFAQINRSGGRAANWGGADGKRHLSTMLKAVQTPGKAWVDKGITAGIGALDEAAAQNLRAWQALWIQLTGIYDRLKEERHALDFDDLERHALRLLRQDPVSDRLQRYLSGIRHVMVDEFQDTNLIQQEIVYHLAPPGAAGRLFVVGDAKQSIYRFRQAQVSIFHHTARDVKQATGHDPQPLNRSFRMHQELVNGLNHLFDQILQPLDGSRHQPYEAPPGSLSAARVAPSGDPPIELWVLPAEDANGVSVQAQDGRRWEAHLLADRLLALHDAAVPVWDKDQGTYRPFQFKDAAILFRATTDLPLYEEVFKQKGLPYLTVSGRGYYDRPEVQDLLALLAVLHNPADDLNLAAVLRSPLFGLSDETLYRLRWRDVFDQRHAEPLALRAALSAPPPTQQADAVGYARAVLDDLWAATGRVDVWRLLRLALDRTGYETTLALRDRSGEGGGRQMSNVQKFLVMAREKGGANLSDFLRRVTDLRTAEAREGEALGREPESGAVQLMSIHASKGLEFPVVAVADLGRMQRRSGGDTILHDPAIGLVCKVRDENGDWQSPASYGWGQWQIEQMEEAENKRLLYVACTRAADRLILSGKVGRSADTSWLGQILAAWQIDGDGDEQEAWHSTCLGGNSEPFRLIIRRPTTRPDELHSASAVDTCHPGLTQVPALTRPLPAQASQDGKSVARFVRDRKRAAQGEDELPLLQPAVRPQRPDQPSYGVSHHQLNTIVHRALADWDLLGQPTEELHATLIGFARGLGITDPNSVDDVARRARHLVANLQRTSLFAQIQSARRRLHVVPFTLASDQGVLHGVIDLLFEDDAGWHLLDWKSEWVWAEEVESKAETFLPQLTLHHHAARRILGLRPRTGACFLAARASVHWYSEQQLATDLLGQGI